MYKEFMNVMENYNNADDYSTRELLFSEISDKIEDFLNKNNLDFVVRYGHGIGGKAQCPWVMISDADVTNTANNGIYIVYLFKPNMSGFYLSLSQGTERETLNDLRTKVEFYRKLIKECVFSIDPIDLTSTIHNQNGRPRKYENANIISRYYPRNNFNQQEIEKDLLMMIDIYKEIVSKFNLKNIDYAEFSEKILSGDVDMNNVEIDIKMNTNDDKKLYVGQNILFYGIPGCGKSYTANMEAIKILDEYLDNKYRVTFYADYTYADFIGQILPKTNNGNLTYEFNPGIFTQALKKAYSTTDPVVLIVEEINRGNAPAIFGEVFQLLDRDEFGKSEHPIKNSNIALELGLKIDADIILPNNFFIFATMNTSDQNVFILDTAFKRRWTMKYIEDEGCDKYIDKVVPNLINNLNGQNTPITWNEFHKQVNTIIETKLLETYNSEDKGIGYFFIKDYELNSPELFGEKVLQYLWFDVFNLRPNEIFNFSSFREMISAYKNSTMSMYGNDQTALFKEVYKPQY